MNDALVAAEHITDVELARNSPSTGSPDGATSVGVDPNSAPPDTKSILRKYQTSTPFGSLLDEPIKGESFGLIAADNRRGRRWGWRFRRRRWGFRRRRWRHLNDH